jgi:hypothetical protein
LPFSSNELTVGLFGSETTWFRKVHHSGKKSTTKTHIGEKEIINMVFPLAKFAKDVSPVGMFTYPFSMQLPDWLPASIIFCSHIESAKLSINYSI